MGTRMTQTTRIYADFFQRRVNCAHRKAVFIRVNPRHLCSPRSNCYHVWFPLKSVPLCYNRSLLTHRLIFLKTYCVLITNNLVKMINPRALAGGYQTYYHSGVLTPYLTFGQIRR